MPKIIDLEPVSDGSWAYLGNIKMVKCERCQGVLFVNEPDGLDMLEEARSRCLGSRQAVEYLLRRCGCIRVDP